MSITISNSKVSYGPNIVTDGLVGYWDAANPDSYPGSGTDWFDISGNNYTGTLVSGPTYDAVTKSIVFDAAGERAIVNVDSWIRTVNYVTISGWYYHNANTGGAPWGLMTDVPASASSDGFWWHIAYTDGTVLYLRTEDSTSGESGVGGTPFVSIGNWYHLTTIVGVSKFIIYVNGVLNWNWDTNVPFSWANINSDPAYLSIGFSYTSSVDGKIPNVQLYDRLLSSTEVLQNFNSQKSRFGL